MAEGLFNIVQLLERAASTSGGISIYPPGNAPSKCIHTTYHDFLQKARVNAQFVRRINGISTGSIVLLHFDKHSDHLEWFWAVVIAGFTPAISTPFVNDFSKRRKHLIHLFNVFQDPIILTTAALSSEFLNLKQLRIHDIESVVHIDEQTDRNLDRTGNDRINDHPNEFFNGNPRSREDLAVLMLTSGSTGNAKAVCLRHNQIIHSVKGKSKHLALCTDDKFLNWIGMDHVANLLEMHLHAMYLCADQVHVQASDLLMEPLTFLRMVDKHRISYTFSPNFFLASLKRALSGVDTLSANTDFDLSCLKILICGGEANVVSTLVALNNLLLQFNVKNGFLRPGFGMTETCAGSIYGRDCPSYEIERGLEFSSIGTCIPGMKMRITKDEGSQKTVSCEAGVDEVGHLQLSGPTVFTEYFNNPIATEASFTPDDWFITGDKGYIDGQGKLNLIGRSKEIIIINGVKYFPHELETAIDESFVSGAAPSYTVVFPYRRGDSQTEELCVVYLPTYDRDDAKTRTETAEAISNISMMVANIIPYRIIPLTKALLPKSSLGKLHRARIRADFESGAYTAMEDENNRAIRSYRLSKQEMPTTELEKMISTVFCEMFDLSPDVAWVGSSLFDFGISSIELIAFKQRVENRLALGHEIPVFMIMKNPTIRGMAEALQSLNQKSRSYDPVVNLQFRGTKTPLWFVHPGSGEILVYMTLAKFITDRPLYALRARGRENDEEYFQSIVEITYTYHAHMKKVQPTGPYAILGWSLGGLLAFEVAKLLEANGDKVILCGLLDAAPGMQAILFSRTDVLIHASYLIGLLSKQQALDNSTAISQRTHEEALSYILDLAPASRREELQLDLPKLARWVEVMYSLFKLMGGYVLSGDVETLDVFYASESGLMRQDVWVEHTKQWIGFSRRTVGYHECDGEHHTMLTGENVLSFRKLLNMVLKAKGV